jgi:hypothetical protein
MPEEYFAVTVGAPEPISRKRFKKIKWEQTAQLPALFTALSESFYENDIYCDLVINDYPYPSWAPEYAVLLGELLYLLKFIDSKTKKMFLLDFDAEGCHYKFTFIRTPGRTYLLDFTDNYGDVSFEPKQVSGTLLDLKLNLFTFYSRTIFLAERICPLIALHPLFLEWRKQVGHQFSKR